MAYKLRSINTKFWEDPWVEGLSPKDKLLYLYLITNSKTNMLGIYEVSVSKISFETGLTKIEIDKAFKGFERVKKAYHIDNFIILANFLKNQKMNPNMLKSAKKEHETLPQWLLDMLFANGSEGFESLTKGFEMVRKIEVEDESEIEDEIGKEKRETEFVKFWDLYGKKEGKEDSRKEFLKLTKSEVDLIFQNLPAYVNKTPDITFRKNPLKWIKGKHWNDEIRTKPEKKKSKPGWGKVPL